jgi:hypothetical protein
MTATVRLAAAALLVAPVIALGGVDTTLQVFDQHAYDTRVHPAYGAFVRAGNAKPRKELLRDTIRRLREHPIRTTTPGAPDPVVRVDGVRQGAELQREYDLLLRMLENVRERPALRLVVEVC